MSAFACRCAPVEPAPGSNPHFQITHDRRPEGITVTARGEARRYGCPIRLGVNCPPTGALRSRSQDFGARESARAASTLAAVKSSRAASFVLFFTDRTDP